MDIYQKSSTREIPLELFDHVVELVIDLFRAGVAHRGLYDVPVGVTFGPVRLMVSFGLK